MRCVVLRGMKKSGSKTGRAERQSSKPASGLHRRQGTEEQQQVAGPAASRLPFLDSKRLRAVPISQMLCLVCCAERRVHGVQR